MEKNWQNCFVPWPFFTLFQLPHNFPLVIKTLCCVFFLAETRRELREIDLSQLSLRFFLSTDVFLAVKVSELRNGRAFDFFLPPLL